MNQSRPVVAVVGAGPAGIFAAKELAGQGVRVLLLNRDIKPGGLAEYGIFLDKYKMKDGLRKQFRQVLSDSLIDYFGNITVGLEGDITLPQLCELGFDAVLVTAGAQGTKWLGTEGEELNGVYHAKDLVYFYNKLPPFSEGEYPIGRKAAIIGAGNVMMDIANWMIRHLKIDEVIAIVRRDPSAVKFSKKEMQTLFNNLDHAALTAEIERTRPIMEAVGIDVEAAREFILSAEKRAEPPVSDTRFRFEFLAVTRSILGDESGHVVGIELEDTTLKLREDGSTSARNLGTTRTLAVDTIVFAVGDKVDERFGLPIVWNEFAKNPNPKFPIDDHSYEAYDPTTEQPLEGIFLAGWSREASSGLVGTARKDGINGAKAVLQYLAGRESSADIATITKAIHEAAPQIVTKAQWQKLDELELRLAEASNLPEFKYGSNAEMLELIRSER
jgi:ferredoxin--NADP+ reductase